MNIRMILSGWCGFAIALLVSFGAGHVQSAELVMFESLTCEWCQRWHEEIGEIYPLTTEAECAPLRRVDIHEPRPDDLANISSVVFTPTFVLMDGGVEIARLVGYAGEDFFWSLLAQNLVKLPDPCPN